MTLPRRRDDAPPVVAHVERTRPDRSRRESGLVAVAIAALLAIPLIVPGFRTLVFRPLWLDELHTLLLSRDLPGPLLVSRLAQGADFNPPLLFVIDALMLRLLPGVPPQLTLRLTSMIAAGLALVLLYRVSRERVGAVASAVGVVGLLAHPVFLIQVYEARFYAPWLLLTVCVAISMQHVVQHSRSRWRFIELVLFTAATCMIHYFGIISLACLLAGALLDERARASVRRLLSAMAIGVLPLVAWLPVYAQQRHILSVATWVPPVTLGSLASFLTAHYGWVPLALVVLAVAVHGVRAERGGRAIETSLSTAQCALIGLLGLPFVLVGFSLVVQPALVARYALPAEAGLACLVAIAVARLPLRVQQLLLLAAVPLVVSPVATQSSLTAKFDASVARRTLAATLVAGDSRPVVTTDRNVLYPVAFSPNNRNRRLHYLLLPSDTIRRYIAAHPGEPLSSDHQIVERDVALAHQSIFGFPALLPLDSLRRIPSFFVLTHDSKRLALADLFSGQQVCRVRPHLFLITSGAERPALPPRAIADSSCGRLVTSPPED
jgi:hypothetical protein